MKNVFVVPDYELLRYGKKKKIIGQDVEKLNPWLRERIQARMNMTRRDRVAHWWKNKIGIKTGEDAVYAVLGVGCIGLIILIILGWLTFWGLILSILYKILERLS